MGTGIHVTTCMPVFYWDGVDFESRNASGTIYVFYFDVPSMLPETSELHCIKSMTIQLG